MPQPGANQGLIVILIVLLVIVQVGSAAQEAVVPDKENSRQSTDSAGLILVDALLLRPLGLAATVLGTAAFIVTLPFSLPTRSAEDAAKALVIEPAEYTFARPLGEVEP